MVKHPDFFQMNAASSFFRRSDLERVGAQFPLGLHASEDAMFVADFLLRSAAEPILGLAADATYVYRRRATADSAVDLSRLDPVGSIGRFHDGYLPLMERAAGAGLAAIDVSLRVPVAASGRGRGRERGATAARGGLRSDAGGARRLRRIRR
jgi:hypothetical protein